MSCYIQSWICLLIFNVIAKSWVITQPTPWSRKTYRETPDGSVTHSTIHAILWASWSSYLRDKKISKWRLVPLLSFLESVSHTDLLTGFFNYYYFFFSFTESLKPYFTHEPKNKTAKLHSSRTVVKCSAKGIPKPTVKWVRYTGSGETVIRSGGRFIVFGNLYIFHLQWSDSGKYGCVAQNKYGRAEAHFYITVQTGM